MISYKIDLTKEYYVCVNVLSKISIDKFDDKLLLSKNKCLESKSDFQKCQIIHDQMNIVYFNKQKIYLDDLKREINTKEIK